MADLSGSLKRINDIADKIKAETYEQEGNEDSGNNSSYNAVDLLSYDDLKRKFKELRNENDKVKKENDELRRQVISRREASIKTQADLQSQMNRISERVKGYNEASTRKQSLDVIRDMHQNIQDTINEVQGKTARVLQDQERDLLRSFRARLADVMEELEKERKKNESGSVEWVQKCRKLTEEMEWLRDLSDRLSGENKILVRENKKYKRQVKAQEEDREFLIKQLVQVKKENARLRDKVESTRVDTDRNSSALERPRSAISHNQMMEKATETRYKNIIARLKRQIDSEQSRLRNLRTTYNEEVRNRTELQVFFEQCIDETRKQIDATGTFPKLKTTGSTVREKTKAFGPKDRRKVIELLLSQDHVIQTLYDDMFPNRTGRLQGLDDHLQVRSPSRTQSSLSSPKHFSNTAQF